MIEIIANPSAKNRKAAKCAEAVKKYYDEKGVEYRIHYTDAPRHATRLAEELGKNPLIPRKSRGAYFERRSKTYRLYGMRRREGA